MFRGVILRKSECESAPVNGLLLNLALPLQTLEVSLCNHGWPHDAHPWIHLSNTHVSSGALTKSHAAHKEDLVGAAEVQSHRTSAQAEPSMLATPILECIEKERPYLSMSTGGPERA